MIRTGGFTRRAFGIVEAMMALALLALVFVPLLSTLSGSRRDVQDASRMLGLLEQVQQRSALASGLPASPSADPAAATVESVAGDGRMKLVFKRIQFDELATVAPVVGGEEVRP